MASEASGGEIQGEAGVIATDLCIYGGTSAGIMAAVEAARQGRSVVLVEPGQHLGGMSVEGLGSSDIDNHKEFKNGAAVGGLAKDFYRRLGRKYGKDAPQYKFEPQIAAAVFAEYIAENRVLVRRGARLREKGGVVKQGTRLIELRTENGESFRAAVFVDATYEGDLLHAAGVKTVIGREANAQYGETKNGIRGENTYRQFAVRVDPYIVPGNPKSGVLPTIQDEPLGTPGAGDHRIQGYCFRMCLTDVAANRIPFEKPKDYDPNQYEIYRRYIRAGGQLWTPYAGLPNRKTDLGSWHDLSANLYGMNHTYPGGDYATRERVYREHLTFTQGLCWFLANDTALPESLRSVWGRWGVCKDEFTDNNGWPRQFYVREARRMVSDYVITEHHTRRLSPTPVSDPVAVAYWPPDTHHVRRIVRDGAAYNEGFVFGGNDWGPFGISYRALTPKASECTNLLTPTCPSSSHVAYGAIRIEWTFMALGQACGAAASLAVENTVPVQKVPYTRLRDVLTAAGQIVEIAR
jgi:hypothetical protein